MTPYSNLIGVLPAVALAVSILLVFDGINASRWETILLGVILAILSLACLLVIFFSQGKKDKKDG